MATSSITRNFYISGREAELFANAIEESFRDRKPTMSVNVNKIRGQEELRELMSKRKCGRTTVMQERGRNGNSM